MAEFVGRLWLRAILCKVERLMMLYSIRRGFEKEGWK